MTIGRNDALGRQALGRFSAWVTSFTGRLIEVLDRADIVPYLRESVTADTRADIQTGTRESITVGTRSNLTPKKVS